MIITGSTPSSIGYQEFSPVALGINNLNMQPSVWYSSNSVKLTGFSSFTLHLQADTSSHNFTVRLLNNDDQAWNGSLVPGFDILLYSYDALNNGTINVLGGSPLTITFGNKMQNIPSDTAAFYNPDMIWKNLVIQMIQVDAPAPGGLNVWGKLFAF